MPPRARPTTERLEDRSVPAVIFAAPPPTTAVPTTIDARLLPTADLPAAPRPILLNGAAVGTANQLAFFAGAGGDGSDRREVFVIDTNGFMRVKHFDASRPPTQEDGFGTSVKLPLGLWTTAPTPFLSAAVETIDIDTTAAAGGVFTLTLTGRPADGPSADPAHTTAPVSVRWVVTLLAPRGELTEVRIVTTADFDQQVTLDEGRMAEAQAFRAVEYSSSNVPDANTPTDLPATRDADQLRVTNSPGGTVADVDLTAQPANALFFPGGLPYTGLLALNQRTPAPLNTDPPDVTVRIHPAPDAPEYRAQGYKTVDPGIDQNSDNLAAWASRTLTSPIVPAGTRFVWTVTIAASDDPLTPLTPGSVATTGGAGGAVAVFTPNGAGPYATAPAAAPTAGLAPVAVRAAVADADGDAFPDTVLVTGPGTPIRVAVVSGADNRTVLVAPFDPFGGDFTGGGYVSAADLDGDGRAEFVVTPDEGGGPRVTVFSLLTDGTTPVRANFLGIDDAKFRGGARAALGDVNGDGRADVIVAAGFGGGPRTAVFGGASVLAGAPARLVNDFFSFPGSDAETLRNGSFVAAGDVTGDGFADLIFGGGPGGAPRVFILSGALVSAGDVAGAQAAPVANFFVAGSNSDRGGVRVAATNADGDGRADVVAGSGEGSPAMVRVYLGANVIGSAEPGTFQDLSVFGAAPLPGGVFVG